MLNITSKLVVLGLTTAFSTASYAINSLQLGAGTGDWGYINETWVTYGTSANLMATANCDSTVDTGCNGDYAWNDGETNRWAYLVISAVPQTADNTDVFDVSVTNAALMTSGWGQPPVQDGNSLSPHGIFDTYYEIYKFKFDGALTSISDTQPGTTGTGNGYVEYFDILINSIADGVAGIHFDLFTVDDLLCKSSYQDSGNINQCDTSKQLVLANAPYSHDAELRVPEPGTLALLAIGLLGVGFANRRKA